MKRVGRPSMKNCSSKINLKHQPIGNKLLLTIEGKIWCLMEKVVVVMEIKNKKLFV